MKFYILLISILVITIGCNKIPVGYLDAEKANISPDSLVIKQVANLDLMEPTIKTIENPQFIEYLQYYTKEELLSWGFEEFIEVEVAGEDYYRNLNKIPWVSYQVQGVDGTRPLKYEIVGASKVGGGDTSQFLLSAKAHGDATVQIDLIHEIPSGEYFIDLKISNEGYSHIAKKILKVIVK